MTVRAARLAVFGPRCSAALAGIVGAAWVELRDVEDLRESALYWRFAGCAGGAAGLREARR